MTWRLVATATATATTAATATATAAVPVGPFRLRFCSHLCARRHVGVLTNCYSVDAGMPNALKLV